MRPFTMFTMIILTSLFLCSVSISTVFPVAPLSQDVVGAWVGFTSEANDAYRVVLNEKGGFIAHSFAGGEPALYRIDSWTLDSKSNFALRISPLSTNAYPIIVVGSVPSFHLQFKFAGKDAGWSHDVSLYKESVINDRLAALRASMDRLN